MRDNRGTGYDSSVLGDDAPATGAWGDVRGEDRLAALARKAHERERTEADRMAIQASQDRAARLILGALLMVTLGAVATIAWVRLAGAM